VFEAGNPGTTSAMRWHKRIRLDEDAINLAADIDAVVAINRGAPGATNRVESASNVTSSRTPGDTPMPARNRTEGAQMTDKTNDYRALSREEISELAGEELPERAAMSLVNANVAIPINAAVAANVLSDNAAAVANAAQTAAINQQN
jgi:hypothetical protein